MADTALAPMPLRVRSQIRAVDGTPDGNHGACEEQIDDGRGTRELGPGYRSRAQTLRGQMLLDQLWPCMTNSGR